MKKNSHIIKILLFSLMVFCYQNTKAQSTLMLLNEKQKQERTANKKKIMEMNKKKKLEYLEAQKKSSNNRIVDFPYDNYYYVGDDSDNENDFIKPCDCIRFDFSSDKEISVSIIVKDFGLTNMRIIPSKSDLVVKEDVISIWIPEGEMFSDNWLMKVIYISKNNSDPRYKESIVWYDDYVSQKFKFFGEFFQKARSNRNKDYIYKGDDFSKQFSCLINLLNKYTWRNN